MALPLSTCVISLTMNAAQRARMASEASAECITEVFPEEENLPAKAPCGDLWSSKCQVFCQGTFYTLISRTLITVWCKKCLSGCCVHHFNGNKQAIFNYSGQTLISYSVFFNYQSILFTSQTSIYGYVNKMNRMYRRAYNDPTITCSFLNGNTFKRVCEWILCFVTL